MDILCVCVCCLITSLHNTHIDNSKKHVLLSLLVALLIKKLFALISVVVFVANINESSLINNNIYTSNITLAVGYTDDDDD